MSDIINMISTCGFPIACCIFLMIQNAKQDEYHRRQQDELRKSIDNNTDAIKDLARMLDRKEDERDVYSETHQTGSRK